MSYLIARISIHDRELYNKYAEGFYDIFNKYKGELVLVDEEPILLEGSWEHTRMVVIRFPDDDEFYRWYNSPEYQRLAELRWKASESNLVLVKDKRSKRQ